MMEFFITVGLLFLGQCEAVIYNFLSGFNCNESILTPMIPTGDAHMSDGNV